MPLSNLALVELVEAAVRAGDPATATTTFAQLSAKARTSGTEWASGIAARSEAQLREGSQAEGLYLEAIERLELAFLRGESARARLLYGEWPRRTGRRFEARGAATHCRRGADRNRDEDVRRPGSSRAGCHG